MGAKTFFILCLLGVSASCFSQRYDRFATLDRFFAGIPLQSQFTTWYEYVSRNPHLGIDSTTRNGNHSSLKPGISSSFPFPEQLPVELVFKQVIMADVTTRQIIDSVKAIEVMGLFGSDKLARRESLKFYRGLRRELMRNYGYEYRDYSGPASWFYKGKNKNFPYCSIHHGYSRAKKNYYVMIAYNDNPNQRIKKYPPPETRIRR